MGKDFGPIRGGSHAIVIKSTVGSVDLTDTDFAIGSVPVVSKGVFIGTTGNLEYLPYGQSSMVTIRSIVAGVWHPIAAKQIGSNTTADEIVIQCDLTE